MALFYSRAQLGGRWQRPFWQPPFFTSTHSGRARRSIQLVAKIAIKSAACYTLVMHQIVPGIISVITLVIVASIVYQAVQHGSASTSILSTLSNAGQRWLGVLYKG